MWRTGFNVLPLSPDVPYTLPHCPLAQLPSHLAPPLYWDKFLHRFTPHPYFIQSYILFRAVPRAHLPHTLHQRMRADGDESLSPSGSPRRANFTPYRQMLSPDLPNGLSDHTFYPDLPGFWLRKTPDVFGIRQNITHHRA